MKSFKAHIQIGKNGLTDGIITTIKNAFANREDVKISVLKAAGYDKEKVKEIADEIITNLGNHYTAKIVGFSIFLKKWRRAILRGK